MKEEYHQRASIVVLSLKLLHNMGSVLHNHPCCAFLKFSWTDFQLNVWLITNQCSITPLTIVQFALRKNHLIYELSISAGCSASSLGFVFNCDVELTVRACATVPAYER